MPLQGKKPRVIIAKEDDRELLSDINMIESLLVDGIQIAGAQNTTQKFAVIPTDRYEKIIKLVAELKNKV